MLPNRDHGRLLSVASRFFLGWPRRRRPTWLEDRPWCRICHVCATRAGGLPFRGPSLCSALPTPPQDATGWSWGACRARRKHQHFSTSIWKAGACLLELLQAPQTLGDTSGRHSVFSCCPFGSSRLSSSPARTMALDSFPRLCCMPTLPRGGRGVLRLEPVGRIRHRLCGPLRG